MYHFLTPDAQQYCRDNSNCAFKWIPGRCVPFLASLLTREVALVGVLVGCRGHHDYNPLVTGPRHF